MCGIVGFWSAHGGPEAELESQARAMACAMEHRGPDDEGTWSASEAGVAFGFRRLSIIDLSPLGHQPMQSASRRFTLVFNGEVYNHSELASELRSLGHRFRGHSDTEVILAAFEQWGIRASLPKFIGMFAMAVWDAERRTLSLLRDRLGIKPLHIYRHDGLLAFASEMKPLMKVPGFDATLDAEAVAQYLRYLYVPAPRSIFGAVRKLLPGHILELRHPADTTESEPYWSLEEAARKGFADPFRGGDEEAVETLDATLQDAVRLRLRADVPVGAFLSGGIDSSAVVSLMQEVSSRPVRTFTISFDQVEHDEATHASAVAQFLGTDHETVPLSGSDALELIPRLPEIFDEPLADPSQLPTYLICAAARQHVTVAVSGDGGDELFAGYNRYAWGPKAIGMAHRVPAAVRQTVANAVSSIKPGTWDRWNRGASRMLGRSPQRLAGEKAHKIASLLRADSPHEMYQSLLSAWQQPPVSKHRGTDPWIEAAMRRADIPLLERMMFADQRSYLADDLLAKVDRASMALSLEVRVPILDHRVVELSWRLPSRMKLRDGRSKWILRQVLERRVPAQLIDRPKTGFTVPLADWLRGPLRAWADERLRADDLAAIPGLDTVKVRALWQDFTAKRNNQHLALWAVLMLQMWRERWL